METSSDPPHFSTSLPLGKQQRPILCWEKNIYIDFSCSGAQEKTRTFYPGLLFVGLGLYSLCMKANGAVIVKPSDIGLSLTQLSL